MSGQTTVNGGDGDDIVNVGSLATPTTNTGGNVNSISASLIVNGNTHGTQDVLNVDDTSDTAGNVGAMTFNQITGLGMAVGITYGTTEVLNINLGSGGDTFDVLSTNATTTTTLNANNGLDTVNVHDTSGPTVVNGNNDDDTINVLALHGLTTANGGSGNDTFNIGTLTPPATGLLDDVDALLTLNGNDGIDTINARDDSDPTGDLDGVLNATTLRGLGMAVGIDYFTAEFMNVFLGLGADTFFVQSTHANETMVDGGLSGDIINVGSIAGLTTIRGNDGDDHIYVNVDAASAETHVNGIGALLRLDGNAGSDTYTVYLTGVPYSASHPISIIDVNDSGGDGTGTNFMEVYGVDSPTAGDGFLVRANFVALLPNAINAERINYNATLNQGIAIYGRRGDDYFAFDDNSVKMDIDGGDGNDTFQVGQMFQSLRVAPSHVAAGDEFATIETTRGYLSPGVSQSTTHQWRRRQRQLCCLP